MHDTRGRSNYTLTRHAVCFQMDNLRPRAATETIRNHPSQPTALIFVDHKLVISPI